MISGKDLSKRFGAIKAVDGFSFSAADGRITTLLGGNGSGKTTTLRMIGSFIRPDTGSVSIDGADVVKNRAKAMSRLGMLHDDFGLYPRLTVVEHVRFSGQLYGLAGSGLSAAVEKAVDALGLHDIRNRFAAGLSHGQRMKTALARTIVHSPRNLVLDEPTRGLDVISVRTLRSLLRRLRSEGVCVFMSSHAMAEVIELSDAIIVIDQGRLLAQGTPDEIIKQGGGPDLEASFLKLTGAAA